jgi:hypothetical protein
VKHLYSPFREGLIEGVGKRNGNAAQQSAFQKIRVRIYPELPARLLVGSQFVHLMQSLPVEVDYQIEPQERAKALHVQNGKGVPFHDVR